MISPFNIAKRPMCAGVLIVNRTRILLALGTEERWSVTPDGWDIPITGIGGGQKIGESMIRCATREAREELGCVVQIYHSQKTYYEKYPNDIQIRKFEQKPAPLLYQLQPRDTSKPYALGLPSGNWLHVGIFRARLKGTPKPVDVPGLLWVPLKVLPQLESRLSMTQLKEYGAQFLLQKVLPRNSRFYIPQPSTEALLLKLFRRFGTKPFME